MTSPAPDPPPPGWHPEALTARGDSPGDSAADAAASRIPDGPSQRRRLRSYLAFVFRDAVLVTLIAVSMALSAFAVYEATVAADNARSLYNQSRILDDEATRQTTHLQTLVDSDMQVLGRLCDERIQEDSARLSFLTSDPDVRTLVRTSVITPTLRQLLQGDRLADCAADGYSIDRALQSVRDADHGMSPPQVGASKVSADAAETGIHEVMLMTSALLLAVTVGMLVALDSVGGRRRSTGRADGDGDRARTLLAIGFPIPLIAGTVLLLIFAVDTGVTAVVVIVTLVLLVVGGSRLARRPDIRTNTEGEAATPRWIAELVGAVALVLFATGALVFTYLSIQDRDSSAVADRVSAVSLELSHVARQESMRDLADVVQIADVDAEQTAATQLQLADPEAGDETAEHIAARMTSLAMKLQALETTTREDTHAMLAQRAGDECTPGDAVAPLATDTLDQLNTNPDAIAFSVWDNQKYSRACDIVAAVTRQQSSVWAALASKLTVTLVLLGLAGFILALATDSDRSRSSAWALLGIGSAGIVVGVGIAVTALPTIVLHADISSRESIRSFAADVSVGIQDPCASKEILEHAVTRISGYGPAYEALATARGCEEAAVPAVLSVESLTSEVDPAAVDDILGDLQEADRLGPSTPLLVANIGWYRILKGIQQHDEAAVRDGLATTDAAISTLEAEDYASGTLLHIARFNRALALTVLGDMHAAIGAYGHALKCLAEDAGCRGDGLLDPQQQQRTVLGALSDLELLPDSPDVDAARAHLLGVGEATRQSGSDLTLILFPQEVRVDAGATVDATAEAAVVWYVRGTDDPSWRVAVVPSLATMTPGEHVDELVPVGASTADNEYRADVYTDEMRLVLDTQSGTSGALVRLTSKRLGMSVLVPPDWQVQVDDGATWQIASPADTEDQVVLRRVEGVIPDTYDASSYLANDLQAWVTQLGTTLDSEADTSAWFLDAPVTVVDFSGDSLLGAGLMPFGHSAACGGTVFETVVGGLGVDDDLASKIFYSIRVDRPSETFSSDDGSIELDGLDLQIPESWDVAFGLPDDSLAMMAAGDCVAGVGLSVWEYDAVGSLDDSVADSTAGEEEDAGTTTVYRDYPVPGADDSALIFTSDPEADYWVLLVRADESDFWISFSDYSDDRSNAGDIQAIVSGARLGE